MAKNNNAEKTAAIAAVAAPTKRPGKTPLTPEQKEARAAVLKAETKEDKLRRMAKARVTKAVNVIRLIGNLAAYKPTEEQTDKIMEAIGSMCAAVEARLRGVKRDDKPFTI